MYAVEEYKVSKEELTNLLKSLLKLNTENEWIEFKVNNDNPSMIGEYISALANSAALCNKEHAYLIYGVDDKSKEVLGTDFDFNNSKKGNEPLYNWLYRKLKPQIDFTPYEIRYNTKRVLIIEIDKAKLYPIEFDNIVYIRIGQQKRKLCDYKEKEKKLWDMLNKTSFEEEVALSKLEMQDIFELLDISTYYKMLKLPLPENKEKIIEDFKEEGFLKELYGKLAITNLGAILFARNIHQFKSITRKSIRLIQYKNKDKLETIREINYDNGYAICFEEILKICKKYDVSISLGPCYRPASVADAYVDDLHLLELKRMAKLCDLAIKCEVNIMIEGIGHAPINKIEGIIAKSKQICHNVPYRVMPVSTDIAIGYDHISSAIASSVAVMYGADSVTVVTRSEHLGIPTYDEVIEGVMCTKVAVYSGYIARTNDLSKDIEMAKSRKNVGCLGNIDCCLFPELVIKYKTENPSEMCTMCGKYCPLNKQRKMI